MDRQMQENSGKKQQQPSAAEGRTKASASSPRKQTPLPSQEEKQRSKLTDVSANPIAQEIPDRDQTRVAELAYGLYEQCGREDGHDMEHWLEAERRVLGPKSRP
jgi:hypothetical protein